MSKTLIRFLTLYVCCHMVASASTFEFMTNTSLQVYEGDTLEVCINGSDVSTNTEVIIEGIVASSNSSAIAGLDFSPAQLTVHFSDSSTPQIKCGNFSIIEDGLDEEAEFFNLTLELNQGQFIGNSLSVSIKACKESDIHLQKTPWIEDGFSMVEYCHNNHWIALCDSDWTSDDARVTCRQAGYSEEDSNKAIESNWNEAVHNDLGKVLECSTDDTQLEECMKIADNETKCYLVLVKCDFSTTTTSSTNVVAPTVTVAIIVVVGGSVTVTLVIVLFVLRKRKQKQLYIRRPQDDETSPVTRNIPNPFISDLSSQLQGSLEQRGSRYIKQNEASESTSTKSKHISAPKENVIDNYEASVEYSAPFSGSNASGVPVPQSAGGRTTAQPHFQSSIPAPPEVIHHEYEGVGSLPMPTAATAPDPNEAGSERNQLSTSNGGQQKTTHPTIVAGYSKLEAVPQEYSHLEHT